MIKNGDTRVKHSIEGDIHFLSSSEKLTHHVYETEGDRSGTKHFRADRQKVPQRGSVSLLNPMSQSRV